VFPFAAGSSSPGDRRTTCNTGWPVWATCSRTTETTAATPRQGSIDDPVDNPRAERAWRRVRSGVGYREGRHSGCSNPRGVGREQRVDRLYWDLGRLILDRQETGGWGSKVIERLSNDLRAEFSGMTGLSVRNLRYMRAFAAAWPDPAIVQQVAAQLPWGHHQLLLDKLDKLDTASCASGTPVRRSSTAGRVLCCSIRSCRNCTAAKAQR
jgi:DUF1016 N-terminal domain